MSSQDKLVALFIQTNYTLYPYYIVQYTEIKVASHLKADVMECRNISNQEESLKATRE